MSRYFNLITRLKKGAAVQVQQIFTKSYDLKDSLIRLGSGTAKTPFITLRLIEVRSGNTWHSYLTSVLDTQVLPPYVVADLYRKRWRIEEAFNNALVRPLYQGSQCVALGTSVVATGVLGLGGVKECCTILEKWYHFAR